MAALPHPRSDGSRQRDSVDLRSDEAFSALGDPVCRALLGELAEGPRTATELAEACDLPSTTLYRKLRMLVDGGLVTEGTEIATEGRNATRYRPSVDALEVHIDSHDGVELEASDGADGAGRPSVDRWEN